MVSFKIALRYLYSKKSINVINIIAIISTVGVTIASAALIIILSVFNGIEDILLSQFNAFNPELKVSLNEGKFFEIDSILESKLKAIDNIEHYSFVMEDYAVIKMGKLTHPFPVKGVDLNFRNTCGVDTMLFDGDFQLYNPKGDPMAVVGYQVADQLSIGINFVRPMVIYAAKRTAKVSADPLKAFNKTFLYPSSIFAIDESADDKVLVPLELAQHLFEAKNQASNIEIKVHDFGRLEETQDALAKTLGIQFNIKNQIEQNSFYKIINSERLMIYLILSFVLLIAAFNIIASITMLIVEKKKDLLSFQSIGLSNQQIKLIFLFNGWMSSAIGASLGLILGATLAYLQMKFEIISFGDGSFHDQAYPVSLKIIDFFRVFGMVIGIGFLTSLLPIRNFKKNYL